MRERDDLAIWAGLVWDYSSDHSHLEAQLGLDDPRCLLAMSSSKLGLSKLGLSKLGLSGGCRVLLPEL